ncbi:MAG: DUF5050 domain-containing protein [Bacteroidales bacterium]
MKKITFLLSLLLITSVMFSQSECNVFCPVISPDGNTIYFSSDRDGGVYEIYKIDINGQSNLIRLTTSGEDNKLYPAISPDGTLLAFQQGDYGASSEIYTMNTDGSNLFRLTNNSIYDGTPNFSPDGQNIVFSAWDDYEYPEIFVMTREGLGRTQLTNNTGAYWQSSPIYNPSGTKIYFMAGLNADDHLVMMDTDGQNWVNITPDDNSFGDSEFLPRFNADGTKMLFQTTKVLGYNNGSNIVLADPDGSNWVQITASSNGAWYYYAYFHPTNDKIYFVYMHTSSSTYKLYRMNQDGTDMELIIDCKTLGLDDNRISQKRVIYPNPAEGVVNVDVEGKFTIEIVDLTGKIILTSNERITDISQLPVGIYMAIIRDAHNQIITSEKLSKL